MGPTYDRGERSAVLPDKLVGARLALLAVCNLTLASAKFQTLASLKVELVY